MDPDTRIGGPGRPFPVTHPTAVLRARSDDPTVRRVAHEHVVEAYWKPVYKYIRWKWRESNEGAKDLTQGFFAKALAKNTFAVWNPEQAAFRTFLRLCVDRFVSNESQFAGRQRRAGSSTEPLDEQSAIDSFNCDEYLHREWTRQLFTSAIALLRDEYEERGRQTAFAAFQMYDLAEDGRPGYAEVAVALDVSATQVTNYLAAARRDLRRIVLAKLRELTATDRDYKAEARAVLGIEV